MTIRLLTTADDLTAYDAWVKTHPQGNLWQSLTWKNFQEARGREVRIYATLDDDAIRASALVVLDRTTGGLSTWDCPRGPLGVTSDELPVTSTLLHTIVHDAQKDKCLSVYLSPATQLLETARPDEHPFGRGNWKLETSHRHEQPEATRIIDLTPSEEQILAQMHQKGRYNIKVAQKNGVIVEQSNDAEAFAKLAQETAKRDGFRALSAAHYRAFLEKVEGSFLLLAMPPPQPSPTPHSTPTGGGRTLSPQQPIAALIGVHYGKTGVYYYGASDYAHRALMAPYLLQWEAMKICKEARCEKYDLLGIAPLTGHSQLETRNSSHPWAGVSAFKEKFGGVIVTYPPEQEIVLRPVMKKLLGWKRRFL